MSIASRGLESPVVFRQPAPNASPPKSAPISGAAPRVAHLDEAIATQGFGHLAVPATIFQAQPPGQSQSLFPVQVKPRTYSVADVSAIDTTDPIHVLGFLEFLKEHSIAIDLFEKYRSSLRRLRFKKKTLIELSGASDTQSNQGSTS